MSRLRPLIPAAMVALALVLCAAPAAAKTAATKTAAPVADCQDHGGTLTKNYTAKQLEAALNSINSTTREYTTCANAIQNALNQILGTGAKPIGDDNSGSGGGSGTIIVIVVIVVILLLGGGGAYWAYRRNQHSSGPSD